MKKKSKIDQKIEDLILKLPDDDPRKIEYLERKKRTMHICFSLPDGTLEGAWVHEGEKANEVIQKITNNWYKYKGIAQKQEDSTNNYEKCPKCGGNLVFKTSKHGSFLGCDNFPHCSYTKIISNKQK